MEEDAVHEGSHVRTCVVLGGRGFIGRSLVSRLLRLGNWTVRIADSAKSLHLDESDSVLEEALSSGRASYHCVDVRDKPQIVNVTEDSYVVFYIGAGDLHYHDYFYCYKVIVQGTRNVISACLESGVRKLIYNSTADVVFDGSNPICDGDESLSRRPLKFQSMLTDFKAQAEALIKFANNRDGLLTCALRSGIVFGPGDSEFVPFLVNLAKSGYAKFRIGNGENMSDFIYSDNVAHAHICAAEALDSQMEYVAGKEFFITNLKPVRFWDFVSHIVEGLGYSRPSTKLPVRLVLFVLSLLKWTQEKEGVGSYDTAQQFALLASSTRTFSCNAAKKHLGYTPVVTLEDGIASTLQWLSRDLEKSDDTTIQSKADQLLGCGKVADILLWRNEKITFVSFLFLNLLYYWFFFSGNTFTSSAAQLLFLFAVALYGFAFVPSKIFGFQVKKIPPWRFEISESTVRDISSDIVVVWNHGVRSFKSLSRGGDWIKFFKIAGSIYLLKLILSRSMATFLFTAISFSFTAFFVYEQYELELYHLGKILVECFRVVKEKKVLKNLPVSDESAKPMFL